MAGRKPKDERKEIKARNQKRKRKIVALVLIIDFGILAALKYFRFYLSALGLEIFDAGLILIPMGISFYTFQSLGYIFDVFRGRTEASRDAVKYALSIAFFVHIMQGPIDRSDNLLPQLDEHHDFEYDRFCHGMAIFLFGAFKKVVIADRLAILVNTVYGNVRDYRGQAFWIASVFYTFQIFYFQIVKVFIM